MSGRVILAEKKTKLIYVEDEKRFKLFDNSYKKPEIFNEALNQVRAEQIGFNVPKVLDVTSIDGKWTIVSEFVDGEPLDSIIKKNPDKIGEYLNNFVELQLEIHKHKASALVVMREKVQYKITQADIPATTKCDLIIRLAKLPKKNNVCHGDFQPSNIVVTKDGTYYMTDWSHITQGNVYSDVAKTYLLLGLNMSEELAEEYLSLYCEKGQADKNEILKWVPIVAAALLAKSREDERAYLLRWVNAEEIE